MKRGGWVPRLPAAAWLVLGGDALSAVGTGMTVLFLVVYFNRVRGIDLGVSGLAVSVLAVAGLIGNPLGGWLSDRIGARRACVVGLVLAAAGTAAVTLVHHPWEAIATSALVGLGVAVLWPAQDTLLANVVDADRRSDVFAVRHLTMNVGIGLGGLAAAFIVDLDRPGSFVVLYLVDALTFLAFIPVLLVGLRGREIAPPLDEAAAPARGGVIAIIRDRAFARLWLLTAGLVLVGYAQINVAFPAFATRPGGISAGAVGVTVAANTAAVVAFQLVALRLMAGRRRTTGLVLTSLSWAATWAVTLGAGYLGAGAMAVSAFVLAAVVFAVGEAFLSPSLRPLVNDLAPDELRGRYNGLSTLAWTTGFALGPVIAGFTLSAGDGAPFFAGLIVACLALAVGSARLASDLPAGVDRVPRSGGAEADATALAGAK